MRFRVNAFSSSASLMTSWMLLLTSSIVSGLGSTLEMSDPDGGTIDLVRYETECELLERRVQEVARDVRSCQALPGCLYSASICPDTIQSELDHEYEQLRLAVRERCTELFPIASQTIETCSSVGNDCSMAACMVQGINEEQIFRSSIPGIFLF